MDATTTGDAELKQAVSSSNFYSWRRPNWVVHYEEASPDYDAPAALLLLPGFGVGTFYFDQQLEELSRHFSVYSMDLLGQGKSWPTSIEEGDELCYSADLWTEQILDFISDIVKEDKVHVLGNSLGGFLAVQAAAKRPDLFNSVILANAAPFWAFAPPAEKNGIWGYIWNGTLPAPEPAFSLGKTYFDVIRSRASVTTMLSGVYSSQTAFDEKLISDIITSASQPGGYEAFTSILFSPKPKRTFDEGLRMISQAGLPCCMLYGKDDPWVVPLWGQRALRTLQKAEKCTEEGSRDVEEERESKHIYVEVSPSGHSPNHESPASVNAAVYAWIKGHTEAPEQPAVTRQLLQAACEGEYIEKKTGVHTRLTIKDGKPTNLVEFLSTYFDSVRERAQQQQQQ